MALPPVFERDFWAPRSSSSSSSPYPRLEPVVELAAEPNDAPSGRRSVDVGVDVGGVGGVGGGVALRRRTRFVSFMGRWLLPQRCRPECFDVQVREGPTRKLESGELMQGEERRDDVG